MCEIKLFKKDNKKSRRSFAINLVKDGNPKLKRLKTYLKGKGRYSKNLTKFSYELKADYETAYDFIINY